MKTKKILDSKTNNEKQALMAGKPRSLRPMRSMVAVRSLKSQTTVASILIKEDKNSLNG